MSRVSALGAWPRARGGLSPLMVAAAFALFGCGDTSTFALGRQLDVCEENLPTACGVSARCALGSDAYLAGSFPGSRRFVVTTEGTATIQFQVLLTDEQAPGTDLELVVHEPSCGERTSFSSGGRDLFGLTGSDGVLEIPMKVVHGGDHLVELSADAFCSYALKWDQ